MTRVTNFGRKRTYVQAGFASGEPSTESHGRSPTEIPTTSEGSSKKRRRTKKSANDFSGDKAHTGPQEDNGEGGKDKSLSEHRIPKRKSTKNKRGRDASLLSSNNPMQRSENRRLKRIAKRQEDTVCFVCREKGHAAKDCTKTVGDARAGEGGKKVVGICYRCGSTRHTLSRCKKPEDPLNPLPFASCFVCFSKGHLASSCPKNAGKGIYPNGGCCKLCGEKTHLAKDCELRKRDRSGTAANKIFGTGEEAGADEDDFHVFKRKNAEVSNDESGEGKPKKRVKVQAEAHVHTLKRRLPGTPAKVKKIVHF
ncbi:hypothetical protein EDD16DRAFT_867817 [Pisolithus croceorrhizus]|nr:hypothetical protein EDD16DRAFT_867817 [Pisolithus croceorrhizus]